LDAAVDDVMSVATQPGGPSLTASTEWERSEQLMRFWFDRMAHNSPRPLQEKMAFFWHGHFCSDLPKVGSADLMAEQIGLFRWYGLGNFRSLAISMATQPAMLRYLDNNQNLASSPNQNFARELLELFLLGVGNYNEGDVEAATAAWTGHTDDYASKRYVWRPEWHDGRAKSFLGTTINVGGDPARHGDETITVALSTGRVPLDAAHAVNRGRLTRDVAAEFISRKLWYYFAGTEPSSEVLTALRQTAVQHDFEIRPWLRALLLRPEFYSAEVKQGLLRSPVDFIVACLVATGLRATPNVPLWLMAGMGQLPLYPPNVAGWKHNDYFINASAMGKRAQAVRYYLWRCMLGYWEGDRLMHLRRGTISRDEVSGYYADKPDALVDRILELMDVELSAPSRDALYAFARRTEWWERDDVVGLVLLLPEFHAA